MVKNSKSSSEKFDKIADKIVERYPDFSLKTLKLIREKIEEFGANVYQKSKRQNPANFKYLEEENSNTRKFSFMSIILNIVQAYELIKKLNEEKKEILFVGTINNDIANFIESEAKALFQPRVTTRWLGGTLTNFKTISKSIEKLVKLEELSKSSDFKKYTKKEQIAKIKEINKLNKFLGGIKEMKKIPAAIVIVDPYIEDNALNEAITKKIPNIIGISDIRQNPDKLTVNIPCNTKSKKTIWFILSILFDALKGEEKKNIIGKENFSYPKFISSLTK
ncbi:MAG: 30S ribosomal protein S2 [Mycoplasmataceae bacterium]|nr:30S ribosomal protein S2 [Mycoplasmataceae bacterium]